MRDEQTDSTAVEWGREEQQRSAAQAEMAREAPGVLAAVRVVIGVDSLWC